MNLAARVAKLEKDASNGEGPAITTLAGWITQDRTRARRPKILKSLAAKLREYLAAELDPMEGPLEARP